jgi:hypothetical protein
VKFIYKPEGTDSHEWDFDPAKLHDVEAIEIEKRTGMTYGEFGQQFMKGSILARKALLFVLLKRATPTLRWNEVQFTVGEIDVDFDAEEKAQIVEALHKKAIDEGLDTDEQQMLDAFQLDGIEAATSDPKDSPLVSGSVPATSAI